jgi:hypothetical protein
MLSWWGGSGCSSHGRTLIKLISGFRKRIGEKLERILALSLRQVNLKSSGIVCGYV